MDKSVSVFDMLRWLNNRPGCRVVKIKGPNLLTGGSTVFGTYMGRTIILQIMPPKAELTEVQAAELKRWEEAGAVTEVIRSLDDAKALISDLVDLADVFGRTY